ncbi:MAG TPA: septal ring lytic transglycosylase RlpA family protein [Terracidiphilus sp.]|jgi:rare lipoprotein A|nr:septal ring lytic transglycosylase RlpA family protein [Terracidiphilus sp.]
MVIRRNASKLNTKEPVQFWLLVALSCFALAVVVLTFFPGTVQANAFLSRPTVTDSPASPAAAPTPIVTAPKVVTPSRKTAAKIPARMLRGIASWYGSVFNGRKTASGETFDMYAMTACHPTLPFGTRVRVIDLANHKSVVVRITDRGDLLNKRIIDLSYAAAQKLEMTKNGLARVKLEIISLGPSPERDREDQPSRQ